MTVLYQLAVLGTPTETQLGELQACIEQALGRLNLRLGHEVGWELLPAEFKPYQLHSSAVVFFGGENPDLANLEELLQRGIPILPVASDLKKVSAEIPEILSCLSCMDYSSGGAQHISSALLACIGLLPHQRRVFVSYRPDEASEAAAQLFEALSARDFAVFLDAYDNADDKEAQLLSWQRLYDSDVLLMLDTPAYFDSRWTSVEFGRVLAKGISVLRLGWPDSAASARSATACNIALFSQEINPATGIMVDDALERICLKLEEVRSHNHAVRSVNLASHLRIALETIGARMLGVGANRAIHIQLANGKRLLVTPTTGVPAAVALSDALNHSSDQSAVVVYDHLGLGPAWSKQLEVLETQVPAADWIKFSEADLQLANWKE